MIPIFYLNFLNADIKKSDMLFLCEFSAVDGEIAAYFTFSIKKKIESYEST